MIFQPYRGQCVRIHYRRQLAKYMPYHGCNGTVWLVSKGTGPRNVGVIVDADKSAVVFPRGNLVAE